MTRASSRGLATLVLAVAVGFGSPALAHVATDPDQPITATSAPVGATTDSAPTTDPAPTGDPTDAATEPTATTEPTPSDVVTEPEPTDEPEPTPSDVVTEPEPTDEPEVTPEPTEPPQLVNTGFVDVPASHVFAAEIAWLAETGITTGWSDGTFRPYQAVLRDQMATFLYRYADEPAWDSRAEYSLFRDVVPGAVFFREITWFSATGVTTGWDDGTFRPFQPVLRDQMAAFLYRLAGSPSFTPPAVSPFRDVPTSHVFYREITWLAQTGITTGWSDGTFRPFQPVLRDQMAAFLYRLAEGGYDAEVTATPPTTNLVCGALPRGGCFQVRDAGVSYASAGSGETYAVGGAIGNRWEQLGRWDSRLGYPINGQTCGLVGDGCVQSFEGGYVHWSSASGAHPTWRDSGITDAWISQQWERGPLGYPTGSETCGLVDNQCRQYFQGGAIIWSSARGAAISYSDTLPLFVYGTLRNGESNYANYLGGRTYHERPARLPNHSMWITGVSWAIPDSSNSWGIYGEMMFVRRSDYWSSIARIDTLERYYPDDPGASLYVRARVPLDNGVTTWTYQASPRQQTVVKRDGYFLPSGDWTKRW